MAESNAVSTFEADVLDTVLPQQKEIIKNLHVGPLTDFVAPQFTEAINRAYGQNESFDSPNSANIATILAESSFYPTSDSVRELNIDNERFMSRSSRINGSDVFKIEVFKLPKEKFYHRFLPSNQLQYMHYLIVDSKTGNSTDLLEIAHENSKSFHTNYPLIPVVDSDPSYRRIGNKIVLPDVRYTRDSYLNRKDVSQVAYAHEAGHSIQLNNLLRLNKLKTSPKQMLGYYERLISGLVNRQRMPPDILTQKNIRLERNAWAFAFGVIRKFREQGLDIAPNVTNSDLINYAKGSLETYDEMFKTQGHNKIRFSVK